MNLHAPLVPKPLTLLRKLIGALRAFSVGAKCLRGFVLHPWTLTRQGVAGWCVALALHRFWNEESQGIRALLDVDPARQRQRLPHRPARSSPSPRQLP